LKVESIVIGGLQCSEEREEEDGAREKVEDAIEDHLAVYRDSVSTF
jgi:hypothetical protein